MGTVNLLICKMERNGDNLFIETFDHHSNFYLFYVMGASLSLDRIVNKKNTKPLQKLFAYVRPVVGKHPDLMVAHPTPTIFPTIGRNFEIS